jgi:serine phosphatase RsbU (regulator of sigma subunit)
MKKIFFLFFFSSLFVLSVAQNIAVIRITKTNVEGDGIELSSAWKYNTGDDLSWAAYSFDDSKWDTTSTNLYNDGKKFTTFKGIAWFRTRIYIDSSLIDTPLCLLIDQVGASQIFLDGKPLHSLGTFSTTLSEEKAYNPSGMPLSFQYHSLGEHVLAVRYSNMNYQKLSAFENKYSGFTMSIAKEDDSVSTYFSNLISTASISLVVGIFFLTLGFVHLLIFLFYKKQRTNLYYSIFVFLFGILFIATMISRNSSNPSLSTIIDYYFLFVIVLFFYSLLLLHYSLFKRPYGKYFWFLSGFLVLTIGFMFFKLNNICYIFIFSFITSTVVPSFFIVIKSIRNKIDGAWIIGTGSLSFLLLLAVVIIKLMFFGHNLQVNGNFNIIITFIAIISIPVSMSVYLAREFALTNNNLEKKFREVETLSAKTIEQEKEKQKILETQKDVLEIQVEERTHEIVEQKKLIEEKNKDITDSINYAKRIQEAILPETNSLINLFPDSFILFKPKDIVSGDFYWFAEHQGKKIIAVADCTGHGVPGALMSMIGSNILNKLVIENGITQPDQILNMLNEEIRTALKQKENGSETRDGMDISLISINGNTLEYAGAHRPVWLIRNNELEETKADKFAIGGIQQEQKRVFTKHILNLQKNDTLYLSSDGFADQFGGESGKKLMTKNFKELLLKIQNKSMMAQQDFLKTTIENWKGSREQIDDILVIGIKI